MLTSVHVCIYARIYCGVHILFSVRVFACNCACKLVQLVYVWFKAKETRHHELHFHSLFVWLHLLIPMRKMKVLSLHANTNA